MSTETQKNQEVLIGLFKIMNMGDMAQVRKALMEVCTEGYVIHDPSTPNIQPGIANYIESLNQFMKENSEPRVIIEDMFGVGDKVVTRAVFEFIELKTHEQKKMTGIVISRFENGKIAEEWQVLAPFATPSA
jgi:predicted SnoaL-like aldol condensation-catalyzing enzyme